MKWEALIIFSLTDELFCSLYKALLTRTIWNAVKWSTATSYCSTSVMTLGCLFKFLSVYVCFTLISFYSIPKTAITTVRTVVSYWWVGKLVYYCCCLLALTDIRSISQHADVWFKVSECVWLLPLKVTYTPSILSAWLCICCIYCAESCQWINSEAQRFLWDDSLFAWMHSSSVFIKIKSKWHRLNRLRHEATRETKSICKW